MEETTVNVPSANFIDLTDTYVNMDEGLCENIATKSDMFPEIRQENAMDSNSGDCNILLRGEIAPSTLPNTNRELAGIQGTRMVVPELQRSHQMVRQPIAQPSSLIHSKIHYGYQKQQECVDLSQGQRQSLHQSMSTELQDPWQRQHLYNQAMLQQRAKPSALQHTASSNRQPLEQNFQQVSQPLSIFGSSYSMASQQNFQQVSQRLNILGPSDSMASQHNFQQASQPRNILGLSESMASQQNIQQASQPRNVLGSSESVDSQQNIQQASQPRNVLGSSESMASQQNFQQASQPRNILGSSESMASQQNFQQASQPRNILGSSESMASQQNIQQASQPRNVLGSSESMASQQNFQQASQPRNILGSSESMASQQNIQQASQPRNVLGSSDSMASQQNFQQASQPQNILGSSESMASQQNIQQASQPRNVLGSSESMTSQQNFQQASQPRNILGSSESMASQQNFQQASQPRNILGSSEFLASQQNIQQASQPRNILGSSESLASQQNFQQASHPRNILGSSESMASQQNFQQASQPQNLLGSSESMTSQHNFQQTSQPLNILGSSSHQNFQQASQPMQFHQQQITGTLRDILPQDMQKNMQMPTSHPQTLIIGNESKPIEQPKNLSHYAFSDSTSQNELPNKAEWHDKAYQQLQTLMEMYLPELIKYFKTTQELCRQPPNAELAIKYEKTKLFVEKAIKLLHMTKSDFAHCSKEKVYNYMDVITKYIYQVRANTEQHRQSLAQPLGSPSTTTSLQQKGNTLLQSGNLPNSRSAPTAISTPQLAARKGPVNSQASPGYISRQRYVPAKVDASEIDPVQRNLARFTQQNALRGPHQSNMITSPNPSSRIELERGRENLITPPTEGSSLTNILSALDPSLKPVPPVQSQDIKYWEERQKMHTQKMKQPFNQLQIDQNKHTMVTRMRDDSKFGQAVNFSPRTYPQHPQVVHRTNYTSQPLISSNSHQHRVTSSQNARSVQHVGLKDLSSNHSRAESAGSPYIVPSPSTPLTPSSTQVYHEKIPSGMSPLMLAENIKHSLKPVPPVQHRPQALDQNGFLAEAEYSHKLAESAEQEETHERVAKGDPHARLREAVKLSSPEALSASMRDIAAVININDNRAGTTLYRELSDIIGEDLADDLSQWEKENLIMEGRNASEKRMKRSFNSVDLEASFDKLSGQESDSESTLNSQIKRPKNKTNELLLEEIKEINKHLVETALDVDPDSTDEVTTVRCSYVALGQFAATYTQFPKLSLRLLVTTSYPHFSPQVLDVLPHGSSENEEAKAISEKVMSKFSLSLRKLSDPISLGEMAKAWDVCAREVFREYAKQLGGSCASSRYGAWENCVVAV